jgi:ABC-type uncharacterized transport system involved in gliding motility auxiliary subunit
MPSGGGGNAMLKRVFDLIAWLGVALVLGAVAVRFLQPDAPYSRWLAWGGLACIVVYILGQWREVARLFAGRSARLGSISVASVLAVLAILGAVNYISSREHKRWDLTTSGEFTLSPQTAKILASLDSPLKMTVFARETEFQTFRDKLGGYEYASKKVSTEFVDPDKKPALAKQLQIQSYGTIAIQYKDRTERVTGGTEQDVTNGIIKVVTGKERVVYFTQGHGEKDTANAERSGYNGIVAQLMRDNFRVEKLPLAQKPEVPSDASAVIVAGPKTDLLPGEIDALKGFLAKGGKVMLLVDPPGAVDSPPLANLLALAHEWGIDMGNDIVVDASGVGRLLGTDATVPVAVNYPSHPIAQDMDLLTAFPLARSVNTVTAGVNGHIAQVFVQTSANSWAEADIGSVLSGGGKVTMDPAKGDKQGPIPLGAAVTAPVVGAAGDKPAENGPKTESRLVVLGDSDFASNAAIGISGNGNLFMNAVNWLTQQENLIAIRPKDPSDQRLTMTENQQMRLLILSLLLIPGVIFGSGVYAWWRRR